MTDSEQAARGPYRKGRERRHSIIKAAAELFAERGYNAGSMRELGNRVGITQAGLMHHFSDKSELLTEVIRYRDDSVRMALDEVDEADPVARGIGIARHAREHPGLTSLFTVLSAEASTPSHAAHDYFEARYRLSTEVTAEENRRRQAAGLMRDDVDPETVAAIMIAVLDGAQLQQSYLPHLDAERVVVALWKMLEPARVGDQAECDAEPSDSARATPDRAPAASEASTPLE